MWNIEVFDRIRHQRAHFSCGYPALDRYIREQASQDIKRDITRVFVACAPGQDDVQGYYTLSAASFRKDELPEVLAKKLPHYPIPAAILGRLAVDQSCQGQRLGRYLLMDCLHRVARASESIAVYAVIADAKDESAKAFYEKYGFEAFAGQPLRLYLSVATIRRSIVTSTIIG